MAFHDLTDLTTNIMLLFAHVLVPMYGRYTRKKEVASLEVSNLCKSGRIKLDLNPRTSLMNKSRHFWSENLKKVETEF